MGSAYRPAWKVEPWVQRGRDLRGSPTSQGIHGKSDRWMLSALVGLSGSHDGYYHILTRAQHFHFPSHTDLRSALAISGYEHTEGCSVPVPLWDN